MLFTGSKGTTPRIAWLLRAESWLRSGAVAVAGAGAGAVAGAVAGAAQAQRRRSRTKKPESSIKPTKTPHSPAYRKQRRAHCEWRRLARARTDKHPPIPQRQHHPATPSSENRQTPGGGIEPPRRQAAPGTLNPPTPPQTDRETRRRDETQVLSVIRRQHPAAGGSHPREGNQPRVYQILISDQTGPIDRPID